MILEVFKGRSFEDYLPIVEETIADPTLLKDLPPRLRFALRIGEISHTAVRMREMLSIDPKDFAKFTRDYVRRCCDLVEIAVKVRAANILGFQIVNKPLGAVLSALQRANLPQSELIEILQHFNRLIYVPAKHKVTLAPQSQLYSVPDAIVITALALELSDRTYRTLPAQLHH